MNAKKRLNAVIAVLVVFLVLTASLFGFIWYKMGLLQFVDDRPTSPRTPASESSSQGSETEASPEFTGLWTDNVMNVLLLGTDERSDSFSDYARSDSMMIFSLNRKKHTAKLISLERGMGVPVLDGEYEGQYDWLTHIFEYGGADLVMRTVRECFGVDVQRYVRVNFNTMKQGIEAIGGVDIELVQKEVDYMNRSRQGHGNPEVFVGMNHLNADQALVYARMRKPDSDWERIVRQRKVVQAAVNATKNLSILEMNSLVNRVLPLVRTNFTKGEIAGLLLIAPRFMGCQLGQMTVPVAGTHTGGQVGMGGRDLIRVDFEKNKEVLRDFLYGE